MAFAFAERVQETTTTTGTGDITLAGVPTSPTGRVTFVAGVGNGETTTFLVDDNAGNWEISEGIVTAGASDTLSRARVIDSSTGGSLVNFGAGQKDVKLVPTAESFSEIYLGFVSGDNQATFDIDNVIDARFNEYLFKVRYIEVLTDNVDVQMQVKVGGVVQSAANDYEVALQGLTAAGGGVSRTSQIATSIIITGTTVGQNDGRANAWVGDICLQRPRDTDNRARLAIDGSYGGDTEIMVDIQGHAWYDIAADQINGLRFSASSGNIDIGIDIFGRITSG